MEEGIREFDIAEHFWFQNSLRIWRKVI